MGAHLIECSGNANPQNFGLMSAADWDGVPLARVLDRAAAAARRHRASSWPAWTTKPPCSRQSLPGASWVLPLDALDRSSRSWPCG